MKNLNSYLDRLTSMRMRPEVLQHAVDILKAVPQIQTELENPATSRMKREDIIQEIFPTESREFLLSLVEDGALGSLQDIFKLCFDTGFVIDGFYEECYFNKEIPDIIIVRAIKIER